MLNTLKQKILAIGSPMMVRRLSAKIEPEQFEVTGCNNPTEASNLLEHEQFDMVIVDNLADNAEMVCKSAATAGGIPVTLLLQEKPVNWSNLGASSVDGFLTDAGTNAEMIARIKAFMRRKPIVSACL
jgi:DNA-binding response OmpR family regulator